MRSTPTATLSSTGTHVCGGSRGCYAWARLVEEYPTVARMRVPRASLVEVGTFDPLSRTVAPIDQGAEAALAAWLGTGQLDPAELTRAAGAP